MFPPESAITIRREETVLGGGGMFARLRIHQGPVDGRLSSSIADLPGFAGMVELAPGGYVALRGLLGPVAGSLSWWGCWRWFTWPGPDGRVRRSFGSSSCSALPRQRFRTSSISATSHGGDQAPSRRHLISSLLGALSRWWTAWVTTCSGLASWSWRWA